MLSSMHVGSVLLGIVIGMALGLLVGWPLGRRRGVRRTDYLPPPTPPLTFPASGTEDRWPRPGLGRPPPEEEEEEEEPVRLGASSGGALDPGHPAPDAENDHALIEALRAVNKRLTDDEETRLSRESG